MVSFNDSLALIRQQRGFSGSTEEVSLTEASGRYLAEKIVAAEAVPAWPTAAMDGYAFCLAEGRESYRLAGVVAAGERPRERLEADACVRIMTGALLPEGCDTVVPIERVRLEGTEVFVPESVRGAHVRQIGEEIPQGSVVLEAGCRIGPIQIGLLAQLGYAQVWVYRKPHIGILATGSELVEPGEAKGHLGQIRSVNNYMLASLAASLGADVCNEGIAPDTKEALTQQLRQMLVRYDIVVTTGGVSVGDFDFVKEIVVEEALMPVINKVRLKPGQHLVVARHARGWMLALPGFSFSALATFAVYGGLLIRQWFGADEEPLWIRMRAAELFVHHGDKTELVPVRRAFGVAGGIESAGRGVTSANIAVLAQSEGLALLPEEIEQIEPGEDISVMFWPEKGIV